MSSQYSVLIWWCTCGLRRLQCFVAVNCFGLIVSFVKLAHLDINTQPYTSPFTLPTSMLSHVPVSFALHFTCWFNLMLPVSACHILHLCIWKGFNGKWQYNDCKKVDYNNSLNNLLLCFSLPMRGSAFICSILLPNNQADTSPSDWQISTDYCKVVSLIQGLDSYM
jgi:hypothetical protein